MNRNFQRNDYVTESDQILVERDGVYSPYPLLMLLGNSRHYLKSISGAGVTNFSFIEQRGPEQDGTTPIDLRYGNRILQVSVEYKVQNRTEYIDLKDDLIQLLRPSVNPIIYRKRLAGAGRIYRGNDMTVIADSDQVYAGNGRFIDRGGLVPGESIFINDQEYKILRVLNDFALQLTTPFLSSSQTNAQYYYYRHSPTRDLYCSLDRGTPNFDENFGTPRLSPDGFIDIFRFRAHDPFWYGAEQTIEWVLPDKVGHIYFSAKQYNFEANGDMVFDGKGVWAGRTKKYGRLSFDFSALWSTFNPFDASWFGKETGEGTWFFSDTAIGEAVALQYWGTRPAQPIITIDGPAENPRVFNGSTGKNIRLNYDIQAGEQVVIDTQEITIKNNQGVNLLPYSEGNLATFRIELDPEAPNNINVMFITFGGATDQSSARMTWQNRYIST